MPTPTPARRLPPPPWIRTAAARTSLATARRACTRGRAAPTDPTRPRDRPGHRVAALLEAIIPHTSPTLPVVCQVAPLTAISPTVSKFPTTVSIGQSHHLLETPALPVSLSLDRRAFFFFFLFLSPCIYFP